MLNAIYLLTTMLNTLNMWIIIVNINFVIFLSGLIEKKLHVVERLIGPPPVPLVNFIYP
jgi:hypothetical protein